MKVPLSIVDYIRRAEQVYPQRVAFVDEPDQVAPSWGTRTYLEMARLARAQAAGLDALGIKQGARVAIVSQNSARLLTSFFGVSGYGRILTPINFRLVADEIRRVGQTPPRVDAAKLLVAIRQNVKIRKLDNACDHDCTLSKPAPHRQPAPTIAPDEYVEI